MNGGTFNVGWWLELIPTGQPPGDVRKVWVVRIEGFYDGILWVTDAADSRAGFLLKVVGTVAMRVVDGLLFDVGRTERPDWNERERIDTLDRGN